MAGQHVHVHAHGRGDQGDFDEGDDQHTEPDRVDAVADHQGEHNGQRQQKHGHAFQKAAQHQVHGTNDEQKLHGRQVQPLKHTAQPRGEARDGDVFGQDQSADQDEKQAGGGDGGLTQHLGQHLAGQSAACHHDREGTCSADARCFGRGEPAAIKPANHQAEQQGHAADAAQGVQAFLPCAALACRTRFRVTPCVHHDRAHIQQGPQQARQHTGNEQLADVGLGHDAVDHEGHAGRNHDAQSPGRCDGTGGQRITVAVAFHLRVGHPRHGGRCGQAAAANGCKTRAGQHGGNGQTASQMSHKTVGGAVKFARDVRLVDQVAHQDEQRHHRERIVVDGAEGGFTHHEQGGAPAQDTQAPDHARDQHGHGNGHFQGNQGQHHGQGDQGGAHAAVPTRRLDHKAITAESAMLTAPNPATQDNGTSM